VSTVPTLNLPIKTCSDISIFHSFSLLLS